MKFTSPFFFALLLSLFIGCKATAQKFNTHAVKAGETLQSIARQYNTSVPEILKYNKELSAEGILRPNTILVVPTAESKPDQREGMVVQDSVDYNTPIRFETHRARRKETLFRIASNYDIKVEDLKRYNPELYGSELQKGMVLKIPVFPVPPEPVELDFITYQVLPKETRWSIAHKYGITVDSLLAWNPELPRTTNHLAVGQEIRLPKPPGADINQKDTQLFISYQVPAQKTLFSLSQEYKISREEILRLNPEIVERGGLQEGMTIRLPEVKPDTDAVNTDNYIFYEVKPKMTEYSLTRQLDIRYGELLALNPELSKGLKAGMVLKLPKEKSQTLEVKNALVLDRFDLKDSLNLRHVPRLLILFPFRLDRLNLNNEAVTAKMIQGSNALKYSLGLYSGMLVAMDSVADMGMNVEVKTLDSELSLDTVKGLLATENLGEYSAIIGPLNPTIIQEVANQAMPYEVPVIAPLPVNTPVSMGNVFFSYTPEDLLRKNMLDYMKSMASTENIIIISDEENRYAEEEILKTFPAAQLMELREEEKNISLDLDDFTALLSETEENWVFLETNNFKVVSSVTSILNSSISETHKLRMFTTKKDNAFEEEVISLTHLSNLRFTYPSVYREETSKGFLSRYRQRFGNDPDKYAIRGFDLGMDVLLRLGYKLNLFEVSDQIGVTEYQGNKFNYSKDLTSGYYNLASYILMFENMQIKEVGGK